MKSRRNLDGRTVASKVLRVWGIGSGSRDEPKKSSALSTAFLEEFEDLRVIITRRVGREA